MAIWDQRESLYAAAKEQEALERKDAECGREAAIRELSHTEKLTRARLGMWPFEYSHKVEP